MPVTSISPGNCSAVRPGSDPAERFSLTTGQVPARSGSRHPVLPVRSGLFAPVYRRIKNRQRRAGVRTTHQMEIAEAVADGVKAALAEERRRQPVADVALLHDLAAGKLDEQRVRKAAEVLLEHRRSELPSVSVAVAGRLLESRAQPSKTGDRMASSPQPRRRGVMKSPWTASPGFRHSPMSSGGWERRASFATMCGGLPRTPPTMPTASWPKRCAC